MNGTIHVELTGPRTCSPLIEYLGSRGLAGRLVETDDHCELEVGYAVEPEERLRGEVWGALRDWLAETESPLVLAETPDDGYVLRPAGE